MLCPINFGRLWQTRTFMEIAFGLADEEIVMATFARCPLFSRKRTSGLSGDMSALGQKQTHAPQQMKGYWITSSARASFGQAGFPKALD